MAKRFSSSVSKTGSSPAWRQRRARRGEAPINLPEVTLSEIDGVRYLHLGTPWVQGAMRIRDPLVLELDYIRSMMVWLLWRPELVEQLALGRSNASEGDDSANATPPDNDPCGYRLLEEPGLPWRVVQLGLGAGALTRFAARRLSARTVTVELNPSVIAACRRHFALPTDTASLRIVECDAMTWLTDAPPGCTEALQVDLYDNEAAAPVLDSADFYSACRRVLAPGGVMCVNLFGTHHSFQHSLVQMAQAFGHEYLGLLPANPQGNVVVLAYNGSGEPLPWNKEEVSERAEELEALLGLPARRWVRDMLSWTPPR